MGLKRRNPARTRLLSATPAPVVAAEAAKVEKIEKVEKVEAPQPVVEAAAPRVEAPRLSGEERHRLIAKIAYGFAERAGFANDPVVNWLAAEREVDALLSRLAS